jgi:copper homeostasis protein
VILEVIVTSVADAIAAEQGGATQLEVISHLEQGGLTPSASLVEGIRGAVRIPIRAMLRERNDFSPGDESELARLCEAARTFSQLGVEGLVLGFLREGRIDAATMQRILACAPGCKATFHHAFEAVEDQAAALAALKQMPQVDCILTSGGGGDWAERAQHLAHLQARCGSAMQVLVGGGVTRGVIEIVGETTPIRAFHFGRAVREPQTVAGKVHAARVTEARSRLDQLPLTSRR